MSVKIEEADFNMLNKIKEQKKEKYQTLGIIVERYERVIEDFEKEKSKVMEEIEKIDERFSGLSAMFAQKYNLNPKKKWQINLNTKEFDEI